MKLVGGLLGLVIFVIAGLFIYLSVSDVQIEQTTVTKSIEIK
jgi:hypothetical protein